MCGVIEGRLSHFLPRWLRAGWQSVIGQGKIPCNTPPLLYFPVLNVQSHITFLRRIRELLVSVLSALRGLIRESGAPVEEIRLRILAIVRRMEHMISEDDYYRY